MIFTLVIAIWTPAFQTQLTVHLFLEEQFYETIYNSRGEHLC